VDLAERAPYAIWQHQGRFRLIDRAGKVLAEQNFDKFQFLPLVVGAGAPEHAAELLDALAKYPAVQAKVVAAVRVGGRRWNLRMQNGMDVLLPEGHAPAALARLMSLQSSHDLLDRPLQVIDMRLPDRLVLRPRPDQPADPAANPDNQAGHGDGFPSRTRDASPGNGRHGTRSLARNQT
jgi:cell division protein FtsQ